MKEIPNHLECAYCIRNRSHGGECGKQKHDDKGCLIFKPDPRGCIRRSDLKIPIPLYGDIPPLNTWSDQWSMNNVDTEIRIVDIKGLYWDKKKGKLIIYCYCEYYVNEYHEDYVEPKKRPVLKLV